MRIDVEKCFFTFPVQKGNPVLFCIPGNIAQSRPAVMQAQLVQGRQGNPCLIIRFLRCGIVFLDDALQRLAAGFHDEKIICQKDNMRRQRQAFIDLHNFVDLGQVRCVGTLLDELVAAV